MARARVGRGTRVRVGTVSAPCHRGRRSSKFLERLGGRWRRVEGRSGVGPGSEVHERNSSSGRTLGADVLSLDPHSCSTPVVSPTVEVRPVSLLPTPVVLRDVCVDPVRRGLPVKWSHAE